MMPRVHSSPAYSLASLVIEPDDYIYLKQMRNILDSFPNTGPPSDATQLTKHLFIGTLKNSDNLHILEQLGITHVLNVAGTRNFDLTRSPYPKHCSIKYLMIPAEDHGEYNIMSHFQDAFVFLDKCKTAGGKVLVHCNLGINRSGAICAAYLMVDQHMALLEVASLLKKTRGVVLTNKGFRRQLIRFARARGYLDVPKYLPQTGSIKFGTDRTNTIKISQYPNFEENVPRTASTDALHGLQNGKEYSNNHVMNGVCEVSMDTKETPENNRQKWTYKSLPRNIFGSKPIVNNNNNNAILSNKRPNATSHYNAEYFMDTIPEDLSSAPGGRSGRSKSHRDILKATMTPPPSRQISKFGLKSQKDFKKAKSRSVSCDSGSTVSLPALGSSSLSTTRPLRVYKRSVTDTEIYQKPSVSHTYKRADTVATTDIASGLERLSLSEKASSVPAGLSRQHRATSRISLSSSIFNRFRSDSGKKS